MRLTILISISIFFSISCKVSKIKNINCHDDAINTLISLSKSININVNSKVYTIDYSTIPDVESDRYKQVCDSFTNTTYLPCNQNIAKCKIYNQKLESLVKLNCSVSVSDFRKYFGVETRLGTDNERITNLFYYFNDFEEDCYNKNHNNNRYARCSLLVLDFDIYQRLIAVDGF